ncbi:MAG: hypothetical protein ACAH95_03570 [Fimbriimonas sp.]
MLAFFSLFARAPRPNSAEFARPNQDHHRYLFMAEHPGELRMAPFAYRVALPALVRATPLKVHQAFLLWSRVFAFLLLAAVLVLCHRLAATEQGAWALFLLASSMLWLVPRHLEMIYSPDIPALALALWAGLAAAKDRLWPAVLLCVVAAFFKEWAVFAAPIAYGLIAERPVDRRAIGKCVPLLIGAVVVLVGLRIAIPTLNHDPAYVASLPANLGETAVRAPLNSLPATVAATLKWRATYFSINHLIAILLLPVTIAGTVLLFMGFASSRRRMLVWVPLAVLVYAQLLVATNHERILVAVFPAALAGAAIWMNHRGGRGERIVMIVAVLSCLASAASLVVERYRYGVLLSLTVGEICILLILRDLLIRRRRS